MLTLLLYAVVEAGTCGGGGDVPQVLVFLGRQSGEKKQTGVTKIQILIGNAKYIIHYNFEMYCLLVYDSRDVRK